MTRSSNARRKAPVGMRIGEVAQHADVNVQTLRYYERRGLLPEPRRRPSGYREYSADTVRLVRFIKRAQGLGFSLRDIEELIELRRSPARNCASVRAAAARKVDDVTDRIRRLTAIKGLLEQLAGACESAGGSCCPIIDALSNDALRAD
jgi:Hg(II)-responsive transcriptional regulator